MTGAGRRRLSTALATLVLAACAGGEGEPPVTETGPSDGVFGRAPAAVSGFPSVVLLDGDAALSGLPTEPVIDQLGLQFSPSRLVVPTGVPIEFRNSESLAHNVTLQKMPEGTTVLDVDMPPSESIEHLVEEPGGYLVTCETHPGMSAYVFVTDAPFGTFADADGDFHLSGPPAGTYMLRVWSANPDTRLERQVSIVDGAATEIDLSAAM